MGGIAAYHRRRARARPALRRAPGRQPRRAADLPAGHRRAGARDRRDAGPLERGRRDRDRLGGRAGAEGRDRRRHGRLARRPAGAPDEPGAAQADRRDQPARKTSRHLHQPAAQEDRRHVRQPGDDHRRQRAQVLRLGAHGHPPDRDDQERHRFDRLAGAGQGGQEQGRPAVPPGRVRHHVQRGHLGRRLRCSMSPPTWAS